MAFIKRYHGVSIDLIMYYILKAVSANLKKNQYRVEEQSERRDTYYMPIILSCEGEAGESRLEARLGYKTSSGPAWAT